MAHILPTLREKKRYLVFEGTASSRESVNAVEAQFTTLFGVVQAAQANLKFIKSVKNRTMLSVNREYVEHARAALASAAIQMHTVGVSGTVKKATLYMGA